MLTKGIIVERVINTNRYKVRIPFLEQAGSLGDAIFDAILCQESPITETLLQGDVVIIGFEEHRADKPVILGKLFLNDSRHVGHADLNSLSVDGYTQLSKNTFIGDINVFDALSRLMRLLQNVDAEVDGPITYTSTVPTAASSYGLSFYVGTTNPETKYPGWVYIII